jgi:hypothetical protein
MIQHAYFSGQLIVWWLGHWSLWRTNRDWHDSQRTRCSRPLSTSQSSWYVYLWYTTVYPTVAAADDRIGTVQDATQHICASVTAVPTAAALHGWSLTCVRKSAVC